MLENVEISIGFVLKFYEKCVMLMKSKRRQIIDSKKLLRRELEKMKASILVLDADFRSGRMLANELICLSSVKEVRCVKNVSEARRAAEDADLVLFDPMFPEMHGTELLQTFTERRKAPGIFVVSDFLTRDMVRRYIQAGATRCFLKPIPIRVLTAAVENWVNQRENGISNREQQEDPSDSSTTL